MAEPPSGSVADLSGERIVSQVIAPARVHAAANYAVHRRAGLGEGNSVLGDDPDWV